MADGAFEGLALSLSGGGARAAYQAGVLSVIAERMGPDLEFPVITGVSAGAINAASVAACRDDLETCCRDLERAWTGLRTGDIFEVGVGFLAWNFVRWLAQLLSGGAPPKVKVKGLLDTGPLHRFLTESVDFDRIGVNLDEGRLRAVALSATSYATGQTVTFVEGDPDLPGWTRAGRRSVRARLGVEHVMASTALPLVFPAVAVDGRYYGDGSIRQGAPLAPAIHLGAERILAISVRYPRSVAEAAEEQVAGYPPPAQILSMLMNSVFLDALAADSERLRRVNRTLELLPPGAVHPDGLRPVELLMLQPSRDLGKLSADLEIHLPRILRYLLRGLGTQYSKSPDFLSYLLFEPPYLERLVQLGRADTLGRWDEVARFLEG